MASSTLNRNLFTRHRIVYLKPNAVLDDIDPKNAQTVQSWLSEALPVIIRRPCISGDGKHVFCGIPLPPEMGKRRLGFKTKVDNVLIHQEPPTLNECLQHCRLDQQGELQQLLDETATFAITPRVVGSVAWQQLTKYSYVTAQSDIDLLFEVNDATLFDRLDQILSQWQSSVKQAYDIEIMNYAGEGFLWKEYKQQTTQIMLKTADQVTLVNRQNLFN